MNVRRRPDFTGFAGALAVLMLLMALALAVGGIWLLVLGGSAYYLVAAVLLGVCALLLARRSAGTLWLYALLTLATLVWALWEAGLDWWPLAARMDVLFIVGCLLLLPWARRPLGGDRSARGLASAHAGSAAVAGALALFAVVAIASWVHDPHDVKGNLPPSQGALIAAGEPVGGVPADEWHAYGRTAFGQRFSPLTQFTAANVADLKIAWQVHTGDMRGRAGDPEETTDEVTPLKIDNRLFLCTPHQSVIALDATTGATLWRYDPQLEKNLALQHMTCRGLSYQPPAAASAGAPASVAADGSTTPVAASGSAAALTATAASASAPASVTATLAGAASASTSPSTSTSPPALPASAGSTASALTASAASAASAPMIGAAPGAALAGACNGKLFLPTADGRLIALDPQSGKVCTRFGAGKGQIDLWAHMPNRRPGAYYSTSPVVVTRHLVIVGGTVLDNASTHEQSGVIRAFNVDTGALVWNWDSGNPEATAPIASGAHYTVNSPNSWSISSVDETLGLVYVPMGNQPPDQWGGNRSAAVERFSSSVVALELASGKVRWVFQTVHHDLWDYDVPSQPTLVDLNIGGASVPALVQPTKQGELFVLDRRTGKPLLPVTEVAAPQGAANGDHTAATQPKSALSFDPPRLTGHDMWGATMFDQLACRIAFHRLRYEGRFTPPSTEGSLIYPGNFGVFNWGGVAVDPRRQIAFTTPAYLAFVSRLVPRTNDTSLLVQSNGPPQGFLPSLNENLGAPFAIALSPFLSPLGVPCQAPPWGYVAGADLRSGKVVWQHRNGTVRDEAPLPLPFKMGVPSLGGPLLTAGGVAFLSGTMDNYVRAYDASTGRQLWQSRLPAGGQATPMTYTGADGRQYLLVVAGGHGSTHTKAGDAVIAYALPAR